MNDTHPNTNEPPQPRCEPWLVRLAVAALLALTVYGGNVLHAEVRAADRELSVILFLGGVVFACVGLLVPWQRFARVRAALHAPDRHLALASRVLGWFAAGLLPFVVVTAPWPVIGLVALLPLAAHELWRRRAWTVWVWYPAAVGLVPALSLAALFLLDVLIASTVEEFTSVDAEVVRWSSHVGVAGASIALLLFAARVTHETFLFHRSVANR